MSQFRVAPVDGLGGDERASERGHHAVKACDPAGQLHFAGRERESRRFQLERFDAGKKDEVELAIENLAVLAVEGLVGRTAVAEETDD